MKNNIVVERGRSARCEQITIARHPLPIREHRGQRVVTFRDIAAVHDVKYDRVRRNFKTNRDHFNEGTDYFVITGQKSCNKFSRESVSVTTRVNLFTETGYLLLTKSLTDDTAWAVMRELVTRYFRVQQAVVEAPRASTAIIEKNAFFDLLTPGVRKLMYYRSYKRLTQQETALLLGVKHSDVEFIEKRLAILGYPMPKTVREFKSFRKNKLLVGSEESPSC
ncbi:MAG: ORF6N domain-containing protein [Candidatus Cloacimonetes bacterium]|nr:ORF6N domain-containing protein [Candidatus Cloacimonadota bacterium]